MESLVEIFVDRRRYLCDNVQNWIKLLLLALYVPPGNFPEESDIFKTLFKLMLVLLFLFFQLQKKTNEWID